MRRERFLFAAIAIALVLLRSFVPTFYEGYFFDSDQAIVGLMARHLAARHDFPLYYYGLNYLLGVQAWIIALVFWLFQLRSSVALMRAPLVLLNIVVALWLIAAIQKRFTLRPALAFAAALPFIVPTPAISGHLLEVAGASIEPFIYVLALWKLRRRPFAFGLLLAIGVLHREFTIFAVPAIVLAEAINRELWTRESFTRAAWAMAGFALVWLVVDDLKLHLSGGSAALQAASLRGQMCFEGPELAARIRSMATEALPIAFGGVPTRLAGFRMDTDLIAGWRVVGWLITAAAVIIVVRAITAWRHGTGDFRAASFGIYLATVGALTAGAYPLSCAVVPGGPPLLRYLLLVLLLPVGVAAIALRQERSALVRQTIVGVLALWGAVNLLDNARLIQRTAASPPLNERRVLTDYLLAHRIRFARAIYWDAYVIDFLSRERVVTASLDLIRIPEYQDEVERHADTAVTLVRLPCDRGEHVASWCVQTP